MSRATDDATPVVVAARHRTFVHWCHDNGINPRKAIWIGNPEHAIFKVHRGGNLILRIASDWEDMLGLMEVVELLRSRGVALPSELVEIRPSVRDGSEPDPDGGQPVT